MQPFYVTRLCLSTFWQYVLRASPIKTRFDEELTPVAREREGRGRDRPNVHGRRTRRRADGSAGCPDETASSLSAPIADASCLRGPMHRDVCRDYSGENDPNAGAGHCRGSHAANGTRHKMATPREARFDRPIILQPAKPWVRCEASSPPPPVWPLPERRCGRVPRRASRCACSRARLPRIRATRRRERNPATGPGLG